MRKRKLKSPFDPQLSEFFDAEDDRLAATVRGIRASISHGGEKGRSVETEVMSLLRDFLPAEYGLSTGFIAYHDAACLDGNTYSQGRDVIRLSEQVDIIIYDALRSGPLVRLAACDVFPLEAVYAYLEVKTSVSSISKLNQLLGQSNRLRSMKPRLYWLTVPEDPTGTLLSFIPPKKTISIRSYVFIMDGDGLGSGRDIADKLKSISRDHSGRNTFISGMYINGKGFFRSRPVPREDDPHRGEIITDFQHPLLAFKNSMLSALSRYPRIPQWATAAIDLYTPMRDKVTGSRKLDA